MKLIIIAISALGAIFLFSPSSTKAYYENAVEPIHLDALDAANVNQTICDVMSSVGLIALKCHGTSEHTLVKSEVSNESTVPTTLHSIPFFSWFKKWLREKTLRDIAAGKI